MAFIYDLADTWNDGGTTFTAIKMNVTDTASASGSLLMDLQVGGSSQFKIGKDGTVYFPNPITYLLPGVGGSNRLYLGGSGTTSSVGLAVDSSSAALRSAGELRWTNGVINGTPDLTLARDAANTLAQRNGTNAQTFNLYNTYTDASNYERGVMKWTGNDLKIGTENAGTGSASRQTHLYGGGQIRLYTGNTLRWYVDASGNFLTGSDTAFDIGAAASARPRNLFLGNYAQLSEMTAPAAPATNNVRIYAEDDGAGKTRLMALFPTGAAQQIAIEP